MEFEWRGLLDNMICYDERQTTTTLLHHITTKGPTNQPRNCTADQPQQEPPRGAYYSLYGLYRIHHKHTTLEFQLLRHYYHDSRPPSV